LPAIVPSDLIKLNRYEAKRESKKHAFFRTPRSVFEDGPLTVPVRNQYRELSHNLQPSNTLNRRLIYAPKRRGLAGIPSDCCTSPEGPGSRAFELLCRPEYKDDAMDS
jgi:hypothetical protein